ncbi:MAG: ABC transporter substrate-binding protein [Phycisphaerales bacterium JB063]
MPGCMEHVDAGAEALRPALRRAGAALLVLWCLAFCVSCGGSPTPPSTDDSSTQALRIVSLSPAVTRMIIDMGGRDLLVGVAQHDDVSLGLPVCGNYLDPDVERILSLEPDLILTESGVQPTSARLAELEMAGVFEVVALPHMESVGDVADALTHPEHGLGVLLNMPDAAQHARERLDARLALIAELVEDRPRPRVLMLLTTDPLGAIGGGVTHDQLLAMAGGDNVLADADAGYVLIDRQMLIDDLRPDVILLIDPNGAALREGDDRLRSLEGLPIPAMTDSRVVVIDHPQALLPSTSLPELLGQMVVGLHPDLAQAVGRALSLEAADALSEMQP